MAITPFDKGHAHMLRRGANKPLPLMAGEVGELTQRKRKGQKEATMVVRLLLLLWFVGVVYAVLVLKW